MKTGHRGVGGVSVFPRGLKKIELQVWLCTVAPRKEDEDRVIRAS